MEGIGTVFGVIALLVALAALWFVNDVVKRVERHNQQFLETHLRTVRESIDACTTRLNDLDRKAGEMAGQVADLQRKDEELRKAQSDHHGRVEALREEVERLDKLSVRQRPPSGRRGD